MKLAACALLGAVAYAASSGCLYLELRAPGESRGGEIRELPLYLAYPDTLGPIAVRSFLEASPQQAVDLLKRSDWQLKSLSIPERQALKALRDLVDGRVREAGEGMAAISAKAPARLRCVLRIDRALILFLARFPADAEKEWAAQAVRVDPCHEAARRNLYSLYLGRQDVKKAMALVDGILASEPKDKWANEAKGYLARIALSDDDWEGFLKEKSEGRDSLFDIQIAYGKYLKDHGRYEEAKQYYTRGLEGAPRNGPAWLDLADVYYRLDLLFLANASLEKAFETGISDPYVYELLGRVLVGISAYAAQSKSKQDWEFGVLDMRDLHWNFDPEWADRLWRLAEKNLESGFSHDLNRRSMAQLLYHVYCHNRKTDAAKNLRSGFWFHFTGPALPGRVPLRAPAQAPELRLDIRLGYVSGPLLLAAYHTDFFEPF